MGEGRLLGQAPGGLGVHAGVEVHAVAGAQPQRPLWERLPGQAHARRQVIAVWIHQAARELPAVRPAAAGRDHGSAGEPRRDVEVRHAPVLLPHRRKEFVPQPGVQREVRAQAPIVLGEQVVNGRAVVGVGAAVAHRAGLGETEQEVGQVKPGAVQRQPLGIEVAGEQAAEAEVAPAVLVVERVDQGAAIVAAEGRGVLPFHAREGFRDPRVLVHAPRGAGVRQPAEVGEGEVRRAVVQRVARCSRNPQRGGHVGPGSEVWNHVVAVPRETPLQGVNRPPLQRVLPGDIARITQSLVAVAKPVKLHGLRVPVLQVERGEHAVALVEVPPQAQADIVVVGGHGGEEFVVLRPAGLVRQRNERQQPRHNGVHPGLRDAVGREGRARGRVVNHHRAAHLRLGKITGPLGFARQGSDRAKGIATAVGNVADEEERLVALDDLRDVKRPARNYSVVALGIGLPGQRLSAEGIRPGVQRRIPERKERAGLHGGRKAGAVTDGLCRGGGACLARRRFARRLPGRCLARRLARPAEGVLLLRRSKPAAQAAAQQECLVGVLAQFACRRRSRRGRQRRRRFGLRRLAHIQALKAARGRLGRRGRQQRGQRRRVRHLQVPFRRRGVGSGVQLAPRSLEAENLHFQRPDAGSKVLEVILAVLIGAGGQLLSALPGRHHGAGDGQSLGLHDTAVLSRRERHSSEEQPGNKPSQHTPTLSSPINLWAAILFQEFLAAMSQGLGALVQRRSSSLKKALTFGQDWRDNSPLPDAHVCRKNAPVAAFRPGCGGLFRGGNQSRKSNP